MIKNKIKLPSKVTLSQAKKYFQNYKILKFLKNSINNNFSKDLSKQFIPGQIPLIILK